MSVRARLPDLPPLTIQSVLTWEGTRESDEFSVSAVLLLVAWGYIIPAAPGRHCEPSSSLLCLSGRFCQGEPLTQSLLNEVEHDHTPLLLSVCLLAAGSYPEPGCGCCQGFILLKLPKLLHPPRHLLLLPAHRRERPPEPLQHFLLGFPAGSDELHRPSVPSPAPPAHVPHRRLSPT